MLLPPLFGATESGSCCTTVFETLTDGCLTLFSFVVVPVNWESAADTAVKDVTISGELLQSSPLGSG